jgi:hypothetical protein
MIIALITGGLGNQLFQYAMARRLAVCRNTDLLLDLRGYSSSDGERRPKELKAFARHLSLFQFQIRARAATDDEIQTLRDDFLTFSVRDRCVRLVRKCRRSFLWKASHVVERKYQFQSEALLFSDNVYLQGYWQSEKYFADVASLIRQEIQPLDTSMSASAKQVVNRLKAQYGEVISLHVRRGDLAHAHEALGKNITQGAPVTSEYIRRAIWKFSENACFFVFSDTPNDIEWCKQNIRARHVEFSNGKSELWDFLAMRFCDHNIIANSTFSWWAAWLNDKPGRRVLAPRTWSVPGARFPMPTDDLLPNGWETL